MSKKTVSSNLHQVIKDGTCEQLRLALAGGGNVNAVDKNGNSVLHTVLEAKTGRRTKFRLLLKAGANPNALDKHGRTPRDYMVAIHADVTSSGDRRKTNLLVDCTYIALELDKYGGKLSTPA